MPLKPFKNKAFSGVDKRRNSVDKRWKKNVDKWNKAENGKNEYKNMQLKVNKYKNKKVIHRKCGQVENCGKEECGKSGKRKIRKAAAKKLVFFLRL